MEINKKDPAKEGLTDEVGPKDWIGAHQSGGPHSDGHGGSLVEFRVLEGASENRNRHNNFSKG